MNKLPKTLPAPERPHYLDKNAKWLAGEGAGSWFVIKALKENQYEVKRYSPDGILECDGIFSCFGNFSIQDPYLLTYPSHCMQVTLEQNGLGIQLFSEHHDN